MSDIVNTVVNAAKVPLFSVALPLIVGAVVIAVVRVVIKK